MNIGCLHKHPSHDVAFDNEARTQAIPHKLSALLLPPDLRVDFDSQLVKFSLNTSRVMQCICPSNCGHSEGILKPNQIPEFPYVEFPGCHVRFCANCKVPW